MTDESPTQDTKKGLIGLENLGNTCYLNAVLQCLRYVADLTVFFHRHSDSWIHKEENSKTNLCNAYKDLIVSIWSATGGGHMRPAGFLYHYRNSLKGTAVEHMIAPLPHDSHEALVFLLDQFHEGMKKPLNIEVTADESNVAYKALMAWKDQIAPNYSPIVDYFFGLMEVSVTCKECSNVSCRYEAFNMLKIGFPESKNATLQECMDYEFKGEALDEYQCDKCAAEKKSRGPAIIQRRIWKLPQNLIIVLKRFNYDGTKCHAQFNADSSNIFDPWFAKNSPESSRTSTYTLQAIVDHHGSANGGHYTAQVKNPITSNWNIYDDESVRTIQEGTKAMMGSMNYILFYKKHT